MALMLPIMKTHPFISLGTAAAFVVGALALPLTAAPKSDEANSSRKQIRSGASTMSSGSQTQADRKFDFGMPGRFVKKTFTRDDDNRSMNRNNDRNDSRSQWRNDSKRGDGSTRFWNKDADNKSDRAWNRDSRDERMKKDEKEGFLSRMLDW
eukprot:gene8960-11017_t